MRNKSEGREKGEESEEVRAGIGKKSESLRLSSSQVQSFVSLRERYKSKSRE